MDKEPTSAQTYALLRRGIPVAELQGMSRREAWGLIRMAKQLEAARLRERLRQQAEQAAAKPQRKERNWFAELQRRTVEAGLQEVEDKWQRKYGRFAE